MVLVNAITFVMGAGRLNVYKDFFFGTIKHIPPNTLLVLITLIERRKTQLQISQKTGETSHEFVRVIQLDEANIVNIIVRYSPVFKGVSQMHFFYYRTYTSIVATIYCPTFVMHSPFYYSLVFFFCISIVISFVDFAFNTIHTRCISFYFSRKRL